MESPNGMILILADTGVGLTIPREKKSTKTEHKHNFVFMEKFSF
jgi:hypothetical protein